MRKSIIIHFVIMMLLAIPSAVYADSIDKNPPKENNQKSIIDKIELTSPGMSKEEVKNIVGNPYKFAYVEIDNVRYEQLSYLFNNYIERVWVCVTYNFIFMNGKLVGVFEDERNSNNSIILQQNKLTIDFLKIGKNKE